MDLWLKGIPWCLLGKSKTQMLLFYKNQMMTLAKNEYKKFGNGEITEYLVPVFKKSNFSWFSRFGTIFFGLSGWKNRGAGHAVIFVFGGYLRGILQNLCFWGYLERFWKKLCFWGVNRAFLAKSSHLSLWLWSSFWKTLILPINFVFLRFLWEKTIPTSHLFWKF